MSSFLLKINDSLQLAEYIFVWCILSIVHQPYIWAVCLSEHVHATFPKVLENSSCTELFPVLCGSIYSSFDLKFLSGTSSLV